VLYKLTYLLSYLLLRKIYSPKNLIVNTCIVVRSLKNTTFQHFFLHTMCTHLHKPTLLHSVFVSLQDLFHVRQRVASPGKNVFCQI